MTTAERLNCHLSCEQRRGKTEQDMTHFLNLTGVDLLPLDTEITCDIFLHLSV